MDLPTYEDVLAARERIRPVAVRTPLLRFAGVEGMEIWLKCENLQVGGAFKFRGAMNAMLSLSKESVARGVVTHSSGNHGAAIGRGAKMLGIPGYVVVPETISLAKLAAIRAQGATVRICAATVQAREAAVKEIVAETGADVIHPFDDLRVMSGQGTCALEVVEELPGVDAIVVPISGGGLFSGTGIVGARHGVAVYGAEPEWAADAAASYQARELKGTETHTGFTIADGLRAAMTHRTFSALMNFGAGVLTCSEDEILEAMRRIWTESKLVVEPSGAVSLASVLKAKDHFRGKKVCVVLTGGNLVMDKLLWVK